MQRRLSSLMQLFHEPAWGNEFWRKRASACFNASSFHCIRLPTKLHASKDILVDENIF